MIKLTYKSYEEQDKKLGEIMTREEIINLDTLEVTEEIFQEIYQSEDVINFQNVGRSGLKQGYNWLILTLVDGTTVNLYLKEK